MGVSHEKFRRPNISFTEGLRKAAGGTYREKGEYTQWMFRALVIAVDTFGGQLETPTGVAEPDENGIVGDLQVDVKDTSSILTRFKRALVNDGVVALVLNVNAESVAQSVDTVDAIEVNNVIPWGTIEANAVLEPIVSLYP